MSLALSLGEAKIESHLNQPLRGSIPVVSASASELGSLRVGLAGQQDWNRAGLSLSHAVTRIKFGFKSNGGGRLAITLRTDEPISEPLLVFLVDAAWSSGHLLREYTVFLDPENMPQRASAPIMAPAVPQSTPVLRSNVPANDSLISSSRAASRYGPVRRGESLSTISERILIGTDLSRHQVVWALYQNNPHAFVNGNINLLTIGANLRVPDDQELKSISPRRARELVREAATLQRAVALTNSSSSEAEKPVQSAAPEPSAQAMADRGQRQPSQEPISSDVQEGERETAAEPDLKNAASPTENRATAGDQLELLPLEPNELSAADSHTGSGQDSSNTMEQDFGSAADSEEAVAATSASPRERQLQNENDMLRERIDETEALLKEIRTLLAARSEQLSELQSRLDRVETRTFNNQQNHNQVAQNQTPVVGWFWWLLLAVAVLIVVLLMLGLFLLARRQDNQAAPSALSYHDDESDDDVQNDELASHIPVASVAAKPTVDKQKVKVDDEVEAFIESNLIMPRAPVPESSSHEPIVPVVEAAEADNEIDQLPEPEVEETMADAADDESAVERRLPAEDSPLDFNLDEYATAKPEATDDAIKANEYEAELDADLGSFDEELPAAASADDLLPLLNDDELDNLEIESELSVPGAGLAGLAVTQGSDHKSQETEEATESATDVSDFSGGDQVATKLDLARVYVDMGDADEARSILSEVMKQGDDHQKQEAQTLLDSLA